jgi:hypothetical protein
MTNPNYYKNVNLEYQPVNTSLDKDNNTAQNNYSIRKKFFLIGGDIQSKRTSNSTTDTYYIGNYVNNKKNGQGKLILGGQNVYEGNFKNGEYDGIGVFKNKNYIYKGGFIAGKKHGKGKLEDLINKSVYEGEFKNDHKDGYGVEKYMDGSVYKGDFKEGKKDGKGILALKGEKNYIYEGEFKNNKIFGKGRFKWDDKKEYFGEWKNNEISGFGILIEDTVKHVGYFENDKKHGYGASFYPEKFFVLLGKWENDNIEGQSIVYSLNNNKDINFDNNEKIVIMDKGNIINSELDEEELSKIKLNNEYNEKIKIFREKLFPEYIKTVNNTQIDNE